MKDVAAGVTPGPAPHCPKDRVSLYSWVEKMTVCMTVCNWSNFVFRGRHCHCHFLINVIA
jgi:hypothetical protein